MSAMCFDCVDPRAGRGHPGAGRQSKSAYRGRAGITFVSPCTLSAFETALHSVYAQLDITSSIGEKSYSTVAFALTDARIVNTKREPPELRRQQHVLAGSSRFPVPAPSAPLSHEAAASR